ncbi:MAG: protein-L-isoaspartate(D-aspartate) O-methyltransferase [Proteobacteria bacterium]|nr:protein-L-isoaspartate(D-aspartate) O-methyltransferase [Pseudomonadota bacterium]MBI3497041.1 protein-L-isoaspartate(D-aspartate) O-methyltransferase [Pseudomonadota bacterium]
MRSDPEKPARRRAQTRKRTTISLKQARRLYAEELRHCAPAHSRLVVDAFATVPRERFLGPGPWTILPAMRPDQAFTTPDADPRRLYHNVLVPIDESRRLNNGEPALWAFLMDQLRLGRGQHVVHIGAGTGYYSAILSEIVGRHGRVTAIEVDPELSLRARRNLRKWPQARVIAENGFTFTPEAADVVVVNAGVTEIALPWLDALEVSGKLLVPLTVEDLPRGWGPRGSGRNGFGAYLLIEPKGSRYAVRFVSRVGIFPCIGGRDERSAEKLRGALRFSDFTAISSLRRPPEKPDDTLWLRGTGYWFSTAPVAVEPPPRKRRRQN